jgi:acyl-CoA thioesterase I
MSETVVRDKLAYGHGAANGQARVRDLVRDQDLARDEGGFEGETSQFAANTPVQRGAMSRRRVISGALSCGFAVLIALNGDMIASAQSAKSVTLVALGDSLSAGYLLPADAAFPVQLEKALRAKGRQVTVINAGVSGDTATGGLDRLDWSVPQEASGVIIELGANDALRGLDPDRTRVALETMITRLKARGIGVMLSGMRAPPNMGAAYTAKFDAIYPDLAAKHGLILDPFFLEGVAGNRELNLADGIHPTAEGVKRITARILPLVERFLDTLPVRP